MSIKIWDYRIQRTLTLKAPRKTASENVVCLCCLLNILADFLKKYFCIQANSVDPDQTAPKEEQSDLGPRCLQKWLLKPQADNKADDNSCDWRFKGYWVFFCCILIIVTT